MVDEASMSVMEDGADTGPASPSTGMVSGGTDDGASGDDSSMVAGDNGDDLLGDGDDSTSMMSGDSDGDDGSMSQLPVSGTGGLLGAGSGTDAWVFGLSGALVLLGLAGAFAAHRKTTTHTA